MMHRAWSSTVEVPYCFSRSYVKFQGHPALKIVKFDPNWALPDCNSSLNLPMAMKCCTKLETAKERCPMVFVGHPSNFKVTRYKTSPILTQIGCFRTIGRSQLSNPSDLPCSCKSNMFFWVLVCTSLLFTFLSNSIEIFFKKSFISILVSLEDIFVHIYGSNILFFFLIVLWILLPSFVQFSLTHWGQVTHICIIKLTLIGSDNGLLSGRHQVIIWTNDGILLIGPLGTNFCEILITIHIFSFKKMHWKMSSAKWRPFISASMC